MRGDEDVGTKERRRERMKGDQGKKGTGRGDGPVFGAELWGFH
jgi:hypothetical protein